MKDDASLELHRSDCSKILRGLAADSVHLCIADPPYGIDGMGKDWSDASLRKRRRSATSQTSCVKGVQPVMPYRRDQGKKLYDFLLPICEDLYRVMMPGSVLIMFSQGRLYHWTACAIEAAGFEVRDMYIWQHEGQAHAATQDHWVMKMKIPDAEKEVIIETLDGRKTPMLKPQSEPMVMAVKPCDGTYVNNWLKWGVGLADVSNSLDGKFPGTIMNVPKPKSEERKGNPHPTIKPVALIEHLVKIFSSPGQIVLDPFMGSGSHGEAALRAGRRFVGIEIDRKYFKHAQKRLEHVK